jgi:AcrR family transcriptional regulator
MWFDYELAHIWSGFMSGLRQKKRAKTQAAILRATAALITKKGFTRTSVEDIARRAQIGVGTVYNYFGSKNALLLALMQRDTEELLKEGEAVLTQPGEKAESVLAQLFWIYARGFLGRYERKMLSEIFAVAFYQPEELGRELTRLDYQLMAQVGRLIEKLQRDGKLKESLPVQQAALVLYAAFAIAVMMYLQYAEMSLESVRAQIASSIELILGDWKATTPPAPRETGPGETTEEEKP